MALQEAIIEHLAQFNTAPILFVGSGLSRRYLALDDWESLLRHFSSLTGKPYEFYKSNANGSLTLTATLIAKDFNPIWWSDKAYEEARKSFSHLCIDQTSPLKIQIAEYIKTKTSEALANQAYSEEIAALKEVTVDGIVTTNWDLFLEHLFPHFKPYIGQKDILFNAPLSIAEIYKIHGCCSAPNSLVLTESDYQVFDSRNPYLAAKLLAFFIEHPVIFIGYSLADENIQSILRSITECLDQDGINKIQDRLLFVEWDEKSPNGTFTNSTLSQNGKTFPIKNIKTASFLPIYLALGACKRKFPAQLLRRLKEHLYDIVLHNDPKGKLYVQDISDKSQNTTNVDVVFGIGAISSLQSVGYSGLSRADIFHDVVFNSKKYDAKKVVSDVIPKLQGFNPIFKYLKDGGFIKTGKIDTSGLFGKSKVLALRKREAFQASAFYKKKFSRVVVQKDGLESLFKKEGVDGILNYTAFFKPENVDLKFLEKFLKEHFLDLYKDVTKKTSLGKLICLYDWLKYSPKQ